MTKQKSDTRHKESLKQETIAPTEDVYAESLGRDSADEEKLQIISFYLDDCEYAFEVTDTVEVLKPRQLTEVPRTPDFIKGILSVRGEMVPVIDLKKRLCMDSAGRLHGSRILIAAVEDLKVGFIVDRMTGVKAVPVRFIQSSADEKGADAGFLKGMISTGNSQIRLLNIGRLADISAG